MNNEIILVPGKPSDGVPILDSDAMPPRDVVLNDLGGNSTVIPERMKMYNEVLADGITDEWFEYVPAAYDGTKKVPLVISCHGGGQHGWGQCVATAWYCVAERENLIVVYPSAGSNKAWLVNRESPEIDKEGNHDLHFFLALIEKMKSKYTIDASRIFLCGMSMGDLMTMQFSRAYGNLLAGAANAEGPSNYKILFNEDGSITQHVCAVPVFQSRGELDNMSVYPGYGRSEINTANRKYWQQINGCDSIPALNIINENNFAFFHGKEADFVYRDIKDRNHGQTFDDAEYIWQLFFSGLSRNEDGSITSTKTLDATRGDESAIAFAAGSKKVYKAQKIVNIETAAYYKRDENHNFITREITDVFNRFYVPISALPELFNISVEFSHEGRRAVLTLEDGRRLQIAAGIIAVTIDNRVYCMTRQAEIQNDILCLPIKWLAENVLGLFVTDCNDAVYISEHRGAMTPDMATIIKEILL